MLTQTLWRVQGKFVPLDECISAFSGLVNGEYDDLPEAAFYMVGNIQEVQSKAAELASVSA